MYKGEKHIVISLLLVLLLPVVYQPLHILKHHSHLNGCWSNSCHENKAAFQKNNHCFICEYEFTVTNLPGVFHNPFVDASVSELIPAKIQGIFSFEVIRHTSPRAPPFLT